ncbi:MAG: GNAT family N-acetyltransferase [Chloroflexota bacterium]
MVANSLPNIEDIPQLRPLNILRDLPAVADLVESSFADTLDAEGRSYIQQMRRAGKDNRFLRWALSAVESVSIPLAGFVWVEGGAIVGNISVIPFRRGGNRFSLIANVAVQPEYRRQGIGRLLTLAAMQYAKQRGASETWLHVRDDNPGAVKLYKDLGFDERARRTIWQAQPGRGPGGAPDRHTIKKNPVHAWRQQAAWYRRAYPEMLAWYQPLPWRSMQAGPGGALYRFFLDTELKQWTIFRQADLLAGVTWQPGANYIDRLWLAAPENGDGQAVTELLLHARSQLIHRRTLGLDFPAGQVTDFIRQAGFSLRRTLIWMQAGATSTPDLRR